MPLPPEAPRLPDGAAVYCASSQAVKQRFDTALPPQADRKPRIPLTMVLEISADAIRLRAQAGGLSAEASIADAYAPAKNPDNVKYVWVDRFWVVKEKQGRAEQAHAGRAGGGLPPARII